MWKTIVRRLILMIPQIIILSMIVFILAKLMPGDPFTGLITPNTSPAEIEKLKEAAGLNNPWYIQYIDWVKNIFHGDLGMSYQFKTPVSSLIASRAMNTLWLSLLSVLLSYGIAIPLAIQAGRYENSLKDRSIQLYTFIAYAIPAFIFYLIGVYIFGYQLHWFPTSGSVDVTSHMSTMQYIMSRVYHMLLPAILMALISTPTIIQYLRTEIIDNTHMDYVKTARSKGVGERRIFTHHIFRNSLLPTAAFMGYSITGLLGGSIFVETIFSYPGMGLLFMNAITSRDYSVITALVLLFGILNLFGSLLSDIILSIVDPRVRIE